MSWQKVKWKWLFVSHTLWGVLTIAVVFADQVRSSQMCISRNWRGTTRSPFIRTGRYFPHFLCTSWCLAWDILFVSRASQLIDLFSAHSHLTTGVPSTDLIMEHYEADLVIWGRFTRVNIVLETEFIPKNQQIYNYWVSVSHWFLFE